jgi:MFS transporter, MHS family, proline/betaine transporter
MSAPRPPGAANPTAAGLAALLMRLALVRRARRAPGRAAPLERPELIRNILGGVVGNVLEWYDFAVFGFLAPVIGEKFFPAADAVDSLLGAFSVFAAAYLVRPIGGMIFGYIGDRLGRQRALQLSVMMMAIPTCLIGFLPTHAEIGTASAVLLVLLRLAQGLSVGGELIGSIAFVSETAPPAQRGYFSSWTFASCYGGMLLGALSAVALEEVLGREAMAAWGWRLPFLSGILIGVAGLWMRTHLKETPVFERLQAQHALGGNPLGEAVRRVPGRILHAGMLVILVGGGFYLLFIWWPTLLGRFIDPPVEHALALNSVAMVLLIVLIPIAGRLSDRVGRRPLLVGSAVALMLLSWPLFLLATQGGWAPALLAQLVFAAIIAAFLGPIPSALVEMFPARVRFSAVGLAYNISLCVFGGTAPLVATWLIKRFHTVSAPAVYLVVLAAINLTAALALPAGRPRASRR